MELETYKFDINSESIVSIECRDKTDSWEFIYHPKNTIQKVKWYELALNRNKQREVNKQEATVERTIPYHWLTETEFKVGYPRHMIFDGEVFIKPRVIISLSNGDRIKCYFNTKSECIEFVKWLEVQEGYIKLCECKMLDECEIEISK